MVRPAAPCCACCAQLAALPAGGVLPCGPTAGPAAAMPTILPSRPRRPQMHTNGYRDGRIPGLASKFLSIVCPVAAALEAQGRRLAVHWGESFELVSRWGSGAGLEGVVGGEGEGEEYRTGTVRWGERYELALWCAGGVLPVGCQCWQWGVGPGLVDWC